MHSKLSRLITLIAILVCLPLQGLAAVSMPACKAHSQSAVATAHAGDMAHCDHHAGEGHSSHKTPCDHCFVCYLGATLALVPFGLTFAANGNAPVLAAPSAAIPETILPSPFHPPRPTFA